MANLYKDLLVWQKSYKVACDVYRLCGQLPQAEVYGLANQMQRAAVSIPSNIAEGQQRNGQKEFKHFLGIAKGSSAELETQLMIANDVYGLEVVTIILEIDEIQRMIQTLRSKL